MSDRLLKLVIGADNRRLRRDFRKATREAHVFGRNAGAKIRAGFNASLGNVATLGTAAGLASVGHEVIEMNDQLTRMGIQAKLTERELRAHEATITRMGLAYGLGKGKVLDATGQIVDLQGAAALTTANIRLMGKSLSATGGQSQDIAKVVSALADAGVKGAEAEGAISAFIEAGDQGSIPFAKMGSVLAGLIPKYGAVTQAGKQGAAEIGAMLQIMGKVTAGNEGESATLMKSMITSFKKGRDRLTKAGFGKLFNKDGTIRDLREMLPHLKKLAEHKDINKLLGRDEAATAVQAMATYAGDYERIVTIAAGSNAINANSMKYLNSEAGRMKTALVEIKHSVASLFTGERIQQLREWTEIGAKGAGYIVDHLGQALLLVGAIKATQLGLTVVGWSKALSQLIANGSAATSQIGVLGAGFAQTAKALGGITAAAGVLAASFIATSAALKAAGYEEWLDRTLGVSSATNTAEADREVLKNLNRKRGRIDGFIDRLADDNAQKSWVTYGASSQSEMDELVAAAKKAQSLRDAGLSIRDQFDQAPGAFRVLGKASHESRNMGVRGVMLTPDEVVSLEDQKKIYTHKVSAHDARASNKALTEKLQRDKLESWLNKRLASDTDGTITADEIAQDTRKQFAWKTVQENGQTPEQARAYAEAKNEEIARQVWFFMKENAKQYGDRYEVGARTIVLQVDGNQVAKVTDNALDRRRSEAE